jgi:hypothetical protein
VGARSGWRAHAAREAAKAESELGLLAASKGFAALWDGGESVTPKQFFAKRPAHGELFPRTLTFAQFVCEAILGPPLKRRNEKSGVSTWKCPKCSRKALKTTGGPPWHEYTFRCSGCTKGDVLELLRAVHGMPDVENEPKFSELERLLDLHFVAYRRAVKLGRLIAPGEDPSIPYRLRALCQS